MWGTDFRCMNRSNPSSKEAVTGVWAENSAGWTRVVVVDRYEVLFQFWTCVEGSGGKICWQMECLVLPGPDLL